MEKRSGFSSVLPDGYRVRTEAKALLCDGGGRLLFVEAILIAMTPLALCFLLPPLLAYALLPFLVDGAALQLVSIGGEILVWLSLWFFALPMLLGVFWIAYRLEDNETAVLSDVFWAFSTPETYRRALRWSFSVLWRIALAVYAIGETMALLGRGISMLVSGEALMTGIGMLVILGEIFLAVLLCLAGFSGAWACVTGARTAKGKATGRLPYRMRVGLRFLFGHMPQILVSVLSLGVLFLMDVLPRMLLGYFRYCRIWNELTIRSEENRDE